MQVLIEKARLIRLFVTDVDGVLSDGKLYLGNQGEELKNFHIFDGLGLKWLQQSGIGVAIITGRSSKIVTHRAQELGITQLVQGREDKYQALDELRQKANINYEQIAYMGDDLPDLGAIRRAGLGMTVANGHAFVKQHADWQSQCEGGSGAVREACEFILRAQQKLDPILQEYL